MKKDKTNLYFFIGAFSIIAIFSVMMWIDSVEDRENSEKSRVTESKLQKELLLNASCNHHVDSLNYINGELSKFKNLTMAMVHKKEALDGLKIVGDIVYMKQDSSRVVIEDVIIGGGKYNYYIKYRVLFKDDKIKEVSPEMIY